MRLYSDGKHKRCNAPDKIYPARIQRVNCVHTGDCKTYRKNELSCWAYRSFTARQAARKSQKQSNLLHSFPLRLSLSSILSLVIYCESISCQVFCSASQGTWLKENVNHNGNGCKRLFDFWQWLNLGMVVYVEFLESKVEICTILFDERVRSTLGKERKRRAPMN